MDFRRPSASDRCLRSLFNKIDADGSGSIEHAELYDALQLLFPERTLNPYTVQVFIEIVDENKTGEIEYHEFYQMIAHIKRWIKVFKVWSTVEFLVPFKEVFDNGISND